MWLTILQLCTATCSLTRFKHNTEFNMQFMYKLNPLGQTFFTRPRSHTGAYTEGNGLLDWAIFVSATNDTKELIM